MNADLRDKIAAVLYFTHEHAGQGDPLWSEILATYGDEHEAVVAYRLIADYLMPTVENSITDAMTDLRQQIARDIQADKPFHVTRDYTPTDAAYDRCAQIARGDA